MWAQYFNQVDSIASTVVLLMLILPAFTRSIKYALLADVQYVVTGGGLIDIGHRVEESPTAICEELGWEPAELNCANNIMSKLITYDVFYKVVTK